MRPLTVAATGQVLLDAARILVLTKDAAGIGFQSIPIGARHLVARRSCTMHTDMGQQVELTVVDAHVQVHFAGVDEQIRQEPSAGTHEGTCRCTRRLGLLLHRRAARKTPCRHGSHSRMPMSRSQFGPPRTPERSRPSGILQCRPRGRCGHTACVARNVLRRCTTLQAWRNGNEIHADKAGTEGGREGGIKQHT